MDPASKLWQDILTLTLCRTARCPIIVAEIRPKEILTEKSPAAPSGSWCTSCSPAPSPTKSGSRTGIGSTPPPLRGMLHSTDWVFACTGGVVGGCVCFFGQMSKVVGVYAMQRIFRSRKINKNGVRLPPLGGCVTGWLSKRSF